MRSTIGKLLVATPTMEGDIFQRSVVFVLHHDADGAHGVVLNKPLETDLTPVLPDWQPYVSEPAQLFQGGPVGLDSAMGLASVPGQTQTAGVVSLFGSIGVVDLDHAPEVLAQHVASLRVFAGYAGWSAGQLEEELSADAWYVVEAEVGDVFTPCPEELWQSVLARQRGRLSWVARFPDDPTMN
ncbi:YqgE/AlgH family protein [Dermatophilus congolensis]|nr:YqgE/AlgH family protein [Dermatophilus congolensis]MBO3129096.1 YqgE/AlgH family protein [Dermatophilus congolensis]MBO3132267.1 YqgE/AlgH family protein [Dermatophilus congolensis]MBO3133572.1 YqgE/AlgH family protein [Dermatophilus congolensis]MBO3135805.1 YqgE/AlgH family protein [Dermatophilus congolensis]MBO3138047.1 YqgE/AlgH family protein [Dermatophilus congolensis]